MLQRLERRKLVARVPDPRDRRRLHCTLLPGGQSLAALRAGTIEASVRVALAHLDPVELAAARGALRALAAALQASPHPPGRR